MPPQLNQQEQEPPAGQQQDSRQQPGSQEAAGQDGFGDDDFGRFEGDGAEAGGALDFADLNAALDDLASAAVQSQSSQQPQQTAKAKPPGSSKGAGPERAPLPSWHARRQGQPVLPEFYVVAEPEVQGASSERDGALLPTGARMGSGNECLLHKARSWLAVLTAP